MDEAEWEGTTIVRDAASEVTELKERDGGELQVHGSLDLAQTLFREGLVDELQLVIAPLVLGDGKRLFAEVVPAAFELVDSQTSGSGLTIQAYRPAGEPRYEDAPPPE